MRTPKIWIRAHLIALVLSLLSLTSHAVFGAEAPQGTLLAQARSLLASGDPASAFDLLSPHELSLAGQDSFDYLLGVAALDSGHPGEAIFSLQRLVGRKPGFAGARIELARAYYEVGDLELARAEFARLEADNPPPKVANTISNYLDAIEARSRKYRPSARYYIDIGTGYDSNAPAATNDEFFGGFRLSPNNLEQSTSFAIATIGGAWTRPLTPDSQLLIDASLNHRVNPSTHFVDSSNLATNIAWQWSGDEHSWRIGGHLRFSALDRSYNKRDVGLGATYGYQVSDNLQLSAFVRAARLEFPDPVLQVRDVDRVSLGTGFVRAFSSSRLNLTATVAQEDAQTPGSPYSNDMYSLHARQTWFQGRTLWFVEAETGRVDYDTQFFGQQREDDNYSVSAGASFDSFPMEGWMTTVRGSYNEKDSTVSLYSYDRYELGITLRKVLGK